LFAIVTLCAPVSVPPPVTPVDAGKVVVTAVVGDDDTAILSAKLIAGIEETAIASANSTVEDGVKPM
jgi:hypothetical protein